MATISAGDINLTVNTTGDFGHHVATLDTARTHITEWRKPVSVVDNTLQQFIGGVRDIPFNFGQSIDLSQYNWHKNQYVDGINYIEVQEDYINPTERYNQTIPYGLTGHDNSNIAYVFDFNDYADTVNCNIEIQYTVTNQSNANVLIENTATGNVTVAPSTSETISFIQDRSFVVNPQYRFTANLKYFEELDYDDIQARITATGRSYLNTTKVNSQIYTLEDSNTTVKFDPVTIDTSDFGNPQVDSIVTNWGVADKSSLTEGDFVTYTPGAIDITIARGNTTLLTGSGSPQFDGQLRADYVGALKLDDVTPPSGSGLKANLDIPGVEQFVTLSDVFDPNQLDNLEISFGSLTNTFGTYDEPGFLQTRAVLIPPVAGFPADLDSAFTTTQSGRMLRIGQANLASAFTTTADDITIFRGILQEKSANFGMSVTASVFRNAASDLNTEFAVDERSTVIMNVLVDDLDSAFAVDGTYTVIIQGTVDQQDTNFAANFRGGIRQAGVSDLLGSFTTEQTPQMLRKTEKNLVADFASTQTAQMFRQTEPDLLTEFAVTPFKPKMFLQPRQQDLDFAYQDTFRGTVFSLGELDDQRRYRFPTRTRTYPVAEETRINTVDAENRTNVVSAETRIRTVNTETRILKETGYEY